MKCCYNNFPCTEKQGVLDMTVDFAYDVMLAKEEQEEKEEKKMKRNPVALRARPKARY